MINELLQSDYINVYVIPWSIRIVTAILIFVIGRWIANGIVKIAERLMQKAKVDDMLVSFIGNIIFAFAYSGHGRS